MLTYHLEKSRIGETPLRSPYEAYLGDSIVLRSSDVQSYEEQGYNIAYTKIILYVLYEGGDMKPIASVRRFNPRFFQDADPDEFYNEEILFPIYENYASYSTDRAYIRFLIDAFIIEWNPENANLDGGNWDALSDTEYENLLATGRAHYWVGMPRSIVAPSVSLSAHDGSGYAGSIGFYIEGISNFIVSVDFSGKYGATIADYKVEITEFGTYRTKEIETPVIPTPGLHWVVLNVTDSRGVKGSTSLKLNVVPYSPPKLTAVKVERTTSTGEVNQNGGFGKITFSSEVSPLDSKNIALYYLLHRVKGSSEWVETSIQSLDNSYAVSGHICIFPAPVDYSYEVAIKISDRIRTAVSTIVPLSSANLLCQATKDGTGLAIGVGAEKSGTFEVGIDSQLDGTANFMGPVIGNALGLSELPIIPEGSDLNYYTTTGTYSGIQASGSTKFLNCPTESPGVLIVSLANGFFDQNNLSLRQIYLPEDNSAIFSRVIVSKYGEWTYGAWKKITLTEVDIF